MTAGSGDSFSAVGCSSKERHPCAEQPLGIEFPGITSCERVDEATQAVTYEPNWVGHLVQTVNAERRDTPLLVYDYSVSGDTISRMKLWQISKEFLPHLAPRPEWAPWTASDTLFVTWIGINDCTWNIRLQPSSIQACFDDLFAAQDKLYEAGARNFCLVDVPPVHTFPGGAVLCRLRPLLLSILSSLVLPVDQVLKHRERRPLTRHGTRYFARAPRSSVLHALTRRCSYSRRGTSSRGFLAIRAWLGTRKETNSIERRYLWTASIPQRRSMP